MSLRLRAAARHGTRGRQEACVFGWGGSSFNGADDVQGPVAGVATGPVGPTSRTAPDDQPRGARRGAASSCWTRLSIWSSRWLACCADWLADSALCAALCTRESSWSRRELIVAN